MFVICAYGNVHMFDCVCLYVLTFVCICWCMSKQMSGWVDICMQMKKKTGSCEFPTLLRTNGERFRMGMCERGKVLRQREHNNQRIKKCSCLTFIDIRDRLREPVVMFGVQVKLRH